MYILRDLKIFNSVCITPEWCSRFSRYILNARSGEFKIKNKRFTLEHPFICTTNNNITALHKSEKLYLKFKWSISSCSSVQIGFGSDL